MFFKVHIPYLKAENRLSFQTCLIAQMILYHLTAAGVPADQLQLMPLSHGVAHLAVHVKVLTSGVKTGPDL